MRNVSLTLSEAEVDFVKLSLNELKAQDQEKLDAALKGEVSAYYNLMGKVDVRRERIDAVLEKLK